MEAERLIGKVKVNEGAYAKDLRQRAIREGITVMVEKTIRRNEKCHEIISLSLPQDNWLTRFGQGRMLEKNVNRAVAEGESVIMIFSRSKSRNI